jgi:exodeoxyribonuclease-5
MLNEQQRIAKDKIARWFNEVQHGGKQIFTLAGYAGTGKTFLINYLIENVLELDRNKIATVTPTGKAASVLIQKGTPACTIHKLIYTCEDSEKLNSKGKPIPKFIKKKSIPDYELVILDEVSMISKKIMQDLISFNIPILAVGDPGQLPPVMAERHDLLVKPDYTLTEIVRQSEEDPIIKVATMARNGEYIPYGKYGDSVYVIAKDHIKYSDLNKLLLKADQVICGKNETRSQLNTYIRNLLGFTSPFPEVNDKIICIQNNYDIALDEFKKYPLVNGNIGLVKDYKHINDEEDLSLLHFHVEFLDEYTKEALVIDDGIFKHGDFTYDRHQQVYFLDNGNVAPRRSLTKKENITDDEFRSIVSKELFNRTHSEKEQQICQFDFGYAISCHKAQGSEFDKVIVFDESKSFPGESKRWLYTAITRAKKKLIIIR